MNLAPPCSFVRLVRLGTLFLAALAPAFAFAGHGHPPVRVGPFLQDAEPTSIWVVCVLYKVVQLICLVPIILYFVIH